MKTSLLNEVIGTIPQVLLFSIIPFVVYLIKQRTYNGFWDYIGLKKSNRKANVLAIATSILFSGALLLLAVFSDEFRSLVHDPASVTGKFKAMGYSISSVLILLVIAIFKTALAEEILFRGFIAKRLIHVLGYQYGNLAQAILFGLIHSAIFMMVTDNVLFLAIILIVPTIGAYISVYLNEKVANGSIVPGWISHALGNVLSYSIIGFVI